MSMCVDMMTAAKSMVGLPERLARLTGQEPECCVSLYEQPASDLRETARFGSALRRFRALADENRLLAISVLKRRGELCACELQAATGLSHATVSHHMAVLEEAGMIRGRRRGKWIYYRLAPPEIEGIP
jgi:hypothetical protein